MVEDNDDLQGTSREGVTSTGTQSTPMITVSPPKDKNPPEHVVTPPPTLLQPPTTPERPRIPFSTTTSLTYCANILSYLEEAGK